MLKLLDGPAAGQVLPCSRAPLFLRAVVPSTEAWRAWATAAAAALRGGQQG